MVFKELKWKKAAPMTMFLQRQINTQKIYENAGFGKRRIDRKFSLFRGMGLRR
jgi:hypothetical protein